MSRNDMNTKLQAFQRLITEKKLSKRRAEVLEALLLAKTPMTSSMLEQWCSTKLNHRHLRRCTITGRFNELVDLKLIEVIKIAKCEITNENAKYYSVIEGWH